MAADKRKSQPGKLLIMILEIRRNILIPLASFYPKCLAEPLFWISAPWLLLNSGVSKSIHTSDFDRLWCVGRPQPDMCTSMTSTRSKVKVTGLLKFRKLHISRSMSSAILEGGWKLMAGNDSMGPSLQLVGARFLNFLLRKLSCDFKLCGMSILHKYKMAIFLYCVRLVTWHVLCMFMWHWPDPRSRLQGFWSSENCTFLGPSPLPFLHGAQN